jgi:hypothetical protein
MPMPEWLVKLHEGSSGDSMKLLITGSSGLLGSKLVILPSLDADNGDYNEERFDGFEAFGIGIQQWFPRNP